MTPQAPTEPANSSSLIVSSPMMMAMLELSVMMPAGLTEKLIGNGAEALVLRAALRHLLDFYASEAIVKSQLS